MGRRFGLSLRQHPHLLRAGELVLRFGHIRSVRVLLEAMAAVRTGAVSGYERNLVLDDDGLVMAVMGDSNVILWFDPAVEVEVAGRLRRLTRVSFWSDDPREVAQRLRARDPSTSG